MSARNAGIRELYGTEKDPNRDGRRRCLTARYTGRGDWPAIIDDATLERVRAILRDPSRRTTSINARSYLLSGYLRCGACDKPLRARPRSDHVRRYVCASGPAFAGCGKVAIVAEPLEELVGEMVLIRMDSPELQAALNDRPADDGGEVAASLAADRARLDEMAADYADNVITRSEWQTARKRLDARISEKVARLSSSRTPAVLGLLRGSGEDMRGMWQDIGFDQRRAIVGALVDHITIGPGRRGYNQFDPSRVSVEWRA